jgi:PAS domain-containing protein
MNSTAEIIGIIVSVCTALVAVMAWMYRNVLKPGYEIIKTHNNLAHDIKEIKKELSPNGGSSIKDVINRIDNRQIIVDHRSKAVFYNVKNPIFEVDSNGNIKWANDKFHKICGFKNLTGLDWVSLIDEPEREQLLREFKSCVKNNRELRLDTRCMDEDRVSIYGVPYREKDVNHGFLIYFNKGE